MDIIQLLDREINRLEVEKLKLLHPLQELFWECTLKCNMQCRHCGSDCIIDPDTPDMPLEHFLSVLDEIASRYNPNDIMIDFVGGEPLVRADIDECIKQASDRGFMCGMVTNALTLDKPRLARLIDSGLDSIAIDIDGLKNHHTWLRRNPHSWDKALKAMQLLSETDLTWDVITCVTPVCLDQIDELKQVLIENGAKKWRLFTITPMGRAADQKDLLLDTPQMRSLMEFIKSTRQEGLIHASAACDGYLGDYEGLVRDHYYQCRSGLTVASVRANGDISGCLSVRSDYSQGNIYRDSFCDVWENKFSCMRDREWMRRDSCAQCELFAYCQGNGMHLRRDDGSLMECHYHRIYGIDD